VIVVTHDHRTLDVFDRILDVEDGWIQVRAKQAGVSVQMN
jgi:ABC-type lipoprotein export system ATPase subunit